MYARNALPPALKRLLVVQDGVGTAAQCDEAGLGRSVRRRLVASGIWQSPEPRLYVGSAAPLGPAQWMSGAVLLGGDGSRLGGESAGFTHGIADAPAVQEVLTPRCVEDRRWVTFRRERPGFRAPSGPAWPPRLGVVDTVLDLCAAADADGVVGWLTTALQRRRTTVAALRRGLAGRPRLRHRELITAVLSDVEQGAHSVLEHRYLRDVERAHGLPRADRQVTVPGSGAWTDVRYSAYGLIVELDGARWHGSGAARTRDRRRDNAHALLGGWATLRYGWPEVDAYPCRCAAEVARVLGVRGWAGTPSACRRCPTSGVSGGRARASGT